MANYINLGNEAFQRILKREYVDKSGLISVINGTLFSEACFTCVSRCRRRLASYFGFTAAEVRALCEKYGMEYEDMEKWYDGYRIGNEPSMFNPSSIMKAIDDNECNSYWASTGSFDAVARYIQMDFEGLRDDIVAMLGGGRCKVDTTSFGNDPAIIRDREEVLTILIHLGYLAYDSREHECFVPNMEVANEMKNAIKANNWRNVIDQIRERRYPDSLRDYAGEVLLCGISYDKDTKAHTCLIERV